jgi:undecaprenyl-diphosphatase
MLVMTVDAGGPRAAQAHPALAGADRVIDATPARRGDLVGRVAQLNPPAAIVSVAISGYVAICVLFAGLGLFLTHELSAVTGWDEDVNRWFAENRTGATNDWTSYATKVADTLGALAVLILATVVFFVLRRRWDALVLLIALGLELATFLTVNFLVGRPRPDVVRLGSLPSTSSFPSGHTAAMVALYGGLATLVSSRFRSRLVAVVCWAVAVLATAAIGYARVYRGMHHPTDVVAGALLGLAALGVAVFAVRSGQRAAERRRLPAPKHSFDPEVVT